MKKRLFCMLLALAMCLTLLPTAALADGNERSPADPVAETPAEVPAEPADPVAEVQQMIDALPTAAEVAELGADDRDAAYLAAQDACDAMDALTGEQQAQLTGLDKLEELLEWFTKSPEPSADDDWVLYLGGVNVRKTPNGTGYSYNETNHTLTLNNYSTNNTYQTSSGLRDYYKYQNTFLYCNRSYLGTGSLNKTSNLIIVLNGTNTLGTTKANNYDYIAPANDTDKARTVGIFVSQNGVTVRGPGSLNIQCQVYAFQGVNYTQESGTVTMKSAMDCMYISGTLMMKGGKLTAETVKNDMPFCAVYISGQSIVENTGMLYVASGATMTATTTGSYYDYKDGSMDCHPRAIHTKGNLFVYGELNANNSGICGSKQTDGNRGIAIYSENKLIIDQGGKVYAKNTGKNSNADYDYGGEVAVRVKALEVGFDGYLYAYNQNSKNSALVVESALTFDNGRNHTAVFTYPYDATRDSDGTIWSATALKVGTLPASTVVVSGLHRVSLYLKTDTYGGQTCWVYKDNTSIWGGEKNTSAQAYASTGLDLTGTTTATYGYNSILPLDYTAIKNIVVENGSQTIKLNNVLIAGRTETEPLITVKSGATLTLLLSGTNYLETTQTKNLISVEEGATLNIRLADGADASSSLTMITADGQAIGSGNINSSGKATINIQSGTIYTGFYSSLVDGNYADGHSCIGDISCNVNISGGYVAADLKGTLKITGGTIPEGCTYNGTDITVDGGSVGLDFDNSDVSVKNSSGATVYKTTVQLYNAKTLKDDGKSTWKTIQYYTKRNADGTYVKQQITLPAVLRLDLTKNSATYSGYGITNLYGTTDEHPNLYLYLPEGVQADLAALENISVVTGNESRVFRANKNEAVRSGTSGKLYLRTIVIGQGIMALRGNPDKTNYFNEVQMSPHYTNSDADIWYDYDNTVEMTIGAAQDNDTNVSSFGVSVLSSTHSITFKRLNVTGGEGQRLELQSSDYGRQSTLNLLLEGSCSLIANETDPVVKLGGTLNISGSYEQDGQTVSTNGRLTLKGAGQAFQTNYDYNNNIEAKIFDNVLSVKDAMLINECTGTGGTYFTSLRFDNATVIGLGQVKAFGDDIRINGGSVDIDVGSGTVKNDHGDVLTKQSFQVANVSDYTKISTLNIRGLPEGVTFAADCVWTDKQGNIHLWLPEGAKLESATIGDTTYYATTNSDGTTVLSTKKAPEFSAPSDNTTLLHISGDSFTLTAAASGAPTPTYQWQFNRGSAWENITSATSSTYTGNFTDAMDGWQYRCVAKNLAGTVESKVFTLYHVPGIATQPAGQTVKSGASATFTVTGGTANNALNVTYQWQIKNGNNWDNIEGATENSYTTSATTASMDGQQYRCIITYTHGNVTSSMTSDAAKLTVVDPPVISSAPVSQTIAASQSASFSIAATGNHDVKYQWQVNKSTDWENIEGATDSTYSTDAVTVDMDGWRYRCVVTNTANGIDNVLPSDSAELTVVGAPVITAQPAKATVLVTRRATFSVTVTGNHLLSFQWQVQKTDKTGKLTGTFEDIPGAVEPAYTTERTALAMNGWLYRCVITNTSGAVSVDVTSQEAKLTVFLLLADNSHTDSCPFEDVTADQYYYDAVLWAVENGITDGVDESHFAPAQACTRAQLAAFLYRYAETQGMGFTGAWMFRLPFTDVPQWCQKAVAWCYQKDIVQGYGNGLFGADDTVTREQVVTMLYRFAVAMGMDVTAGEDTNILSYNDAFDVSDYAVAAFQWATGAGIVQGTDGSLLPQSNCTRSQIVTMLYRLLNG